MSHPDAAASLTARDRAYLVVVAKRDDECGLCSVEEYDAIVHRMHRRRGRLHAVLTHMGGPAV
jgi:hypothetical protein